MEDQGKKHLAPSASKVGKTNGAPLPASLKHEFEASFGSDLSQVRVHESHAPTHLGAKAFAHGSDIFFAPGEYQPHSDAGKKLLSHELTHVVQQRGGAAAADSPGDGTRNDER
ncbi:MAG TPA: hypothetical protein DEP46_10935 [Blastocatellia bacterium]|nr:hypothetical protein [Blastocatellia bacterium]